MATALHTSRHLSEYPGISRANFDEHWYAVQTRARHERVVVQRFREKGLTTFLPLITEVRHWSDRWKSVESPLFLV